MGKKIDFSHILLGILKGTSSSDPKGLSDIIGYVDAREKLIITYEELLEGLRVLVESGAIEQHEHLYYRTELKPTPKKSAKFIEFNEQIYKEALGKYEQRFWKNYKTSKKNANDSK